MKYFFLAVCTIGLLCFANAQTTGEQPDPAKPILEKLNVLAATHSLKAKTTIHNFSFTLKGDSLVLTDDLQTRGYDKKMESYSIQWFFCLRDLSDIVQNQKIAACWIVFVLREKTLSYCITDGKVDRDCHDLQLIWEKKAGKTDAPAQVKQLFRELLKIKGITSPLLTAQ